MPMPRLIFAAIPFIAMMLSVALIPDGASSQVTYCTLVTSNPNPSDSDCDGLGAVLPWT